MGGNGDYEEKRALILEAAVEVDNGAGDSYIAVTREQIMDLRYARELVAARICAEENSVAGGKQSPALRPASDTRSRSSTLPSYDSGALPDYTSQPGSGSGHVANGMKRYEPSIISSGTTALTPDSSIPDISSVYSSETLETRFEED